VSTILELLRAELAGEPAWLVGGAVRDRLLGRETTDLDVAVAGDPRTAAKALGRAASAAAFPLSEAFGAWRVVAPGHAWQVDFVPLREGDLASDLAARDFTINAMAEPLGGDGELVDPFGGAQDLRAGRLQLVTERALVDDPLRALRAVRFATELGLSLAPETAAAVRAHAPGLASVAPERSFAELKRVVAAPAAGAGIRLALALGVTAAILPELDALRGVEQSPYHHLDVLGHTLEVLDESLAIADALPRHSARVRDRLAAPLAEGLSIGDALRFAALLHDVAKPATREVRADGRVTFMGHDALGAEQVAAILRRLRASEKLVGFVAHLTRHHLRLGFMVHEGPLTRRAAWRYLRRMAPYAVETTLLTVADRRATRGRNAGPATAAHEALADAMLDHAFAPGFAAPLVRGDELARALGIAAGPRIGELLAQLEEDRYAGAIVTREDALRRARELLPR
jgi:putative nucleotidyltransferase with HDIG domain